MRSFLPDFITREPPTFPDYITVKHNARAGRIVMRLNTKTRKIDLTIPKWMSLHDAKAFTDQNKRWIDDKLQTLGQSIPFEHGQTIPLLGRDRTITIQENPNSARTTFTLTAHELLMMTHLENPAPKIEKHLKAIARQEFEPRLHDKAAQIGHNINKLTLRDPLSRWGSCSHDGNIMLSWRLILAPPAAMDYVIAHEVAHLRHMDHSKAFWALCKDLSDDYSAGHSWMREHGNTLMRFG
ncbi:MAG: hypothetical protein CL570_02525 [Alphaproteobacteria bacterium]|nr:hypothetical protein [Alphaproteobacteria bacterium]|tara:strand:+ start:54689 stop:55405 length:717 start_codon:yes stop_codon:yes gene_type:complete